VYRILALDGGGIRGLLTAVWLSRLEDVLAKPLWESFDLIAGTSTGALLGASVASGIPAQKVVSLYKERGPEIFEKRSFAGFRQRWCGPKYTGIGLERVADDVFGSSCLGDLKTRLLVTSYDIFRSRAVVFDSAEPEDQQREVRQVCRASVAAPTFFPPSQQRVAGVMAPLVDGGIMANNPALLALAAAVGKNGFRDEWDNRQVSDVLLASFGTGEVAYRLSYADRLKWSASHWMTVLISLLFDGASDGTAWAARRFRHGERRRGS